MRAYVGRIVNGEVHLSVHDPAPEPTIAEVTEVLGELHALNDEQASGALPGFDERRKAYLARKDGLVSRIEKFQATELAVAIDHGTPNLPWAEHRAGRWELAWSILSVELGSRPPGSLCQQFADDVVAHLPPDRFILPAADVAAWVARTQSAHPGPAAAVVETDLLTDGAATEEDEPSDRDPARASAVVAACEAGWASIQGNHPDLPDAVIVLGTGVERGRLVKLGHWWGGRWLVDGEIRGEVLLAGEALHLPPTEVFEVLLHEAAHGLNAVRGIQDTSSRGRYHNARFKAAAEEVGLRVEHMRNFAWARTTLTPEAIDLYAPEIAALGESMRMSRQLGRGVRVGVEAGTGAEPGGEGGKEPKTRNGIAASCGCGRKIRMAPSVLAQGPVVCGLCDVEFVPVNTVQRSSARDSASAVVDQSFVSGRFTDETLRTWRDAWGSDREVLLVGTSEADVVRLNDAARDVLKASGEIRGPAAVGAGLVLMAGDRVVVAQGLEWPSPSQGAVETGLVGVVEKVAADKSWVEIDFAMDGRGRFPTTSLGGGSLAYGYAVQEDAVVADIDIHAVSSAPAIDAGADVHVGAEIEL